MTGRLKERLSGATREQHAIKIEAEREQAAHPVRAFWRGALRNGAGVAALLMGWSALTRAQALDSSKAGTIALVTSFGMAAVLMLVGLSAIMPTQTFTVLRFFGLGGVVDKVLKRRNGEES
jgi:hypothetical protein